MKRAMTVFPLLFLLCGTKDSGQRDVLTECRERLPFALREAKPGSDSAEADAGAEFVERIRKAFESDSSVVHAYEQLKALLPEARNQGRGSEVFEAFCQSPGFEAKTFGEQQQAAFLAQWVADARALVDEELRILYSAYVGGLRTTIPRSGFNVYPAQVRPGGSVRMLGYRYGGQTRAPESHDTYVVQTARLLFDDELRPRGFVPVSVDTINDHGGREHYSARLEIALDTPGVYRIAVAGKYLFQQFYVQASWLDCVVKTDSSRIVVFGSSYRDTVAPPYDVHFVSDEGEVYTTRTDSSGLCVVAHCLGDSTAGSRMKVVLAKGGEAAFVDGYFASTVPETTLLCYTYTDRPIYRPGHKVHVRGIVKRFVGQTELGSPCIDSIALTIRDPQRSVVYDKILVLDRWGHFGDSIELSETARQGTYLVQYESPSLPANRRFALSRSQSRTKFIVEAYRKPEFTITARPRRDTWLVGDTIRIDIAGAYYFGGALADVPVTVRWYRQRMHHYFALRGAARRCAFFPSGGRMLERQEEHRLDKEGKIVVEHEARTNEPYTYLTAEVIATDQSRRQVREEARVKVAKNDAYLNIRTDKYRYQTGDTAQVEVVAVNLEGKALAGDITLLVKKDNEVLAAKVLGADREGIARWSVPTGEPGTYKVEATAGDGRGKTVFTEREFNVSANPVHEWEHIEIRADKEHYGPGDTAHFTVRAGAEGALALCTVEGRRLFGLGVRRVADHTISCDVPVRADMGYNLDFAVTYSGKDREANASHRIVVVDSTVVLRATLEGQRLLQPGAAFDGTVTLRDRAGRPVEACFSAALVDEAIFDAARASSEDDRGPRGRELESGVLTMMPQYYHRDGVETRRSEFSWEYLATLFGVAESRAQGRPAGIGYGAGYGSGFGGGSGGIDGLIGSMMGGGADALDLAAGEARSRAGIVAGGWGVPEFVKGGVARARDQDPPPRQRGTFRHLGYWNPEVVTDAEGRARLSFVMPDDLTKWRLALVGSDGGAHLVEFRDSVVTKLDVMARIEAPRSFVAGDSAVVSTVVHNYADKNVTARVAFEIRDGSRFAQLRGPAVRTVDVARNGTARVDWPVVIHRQGQLSFYSEVRTSEGSDAEARTYPVLVHGVARTRSESGVAGGGERTQTVTLAFPADADPESRTLVIEYAPSLVHSMFQSLEYLTGYPYGCVEQTMSRFLPNLYVARIMKKLGLRNDSLAAKIPEYTGKGLARLERFQRHDGGWGWWENDTADPRMTALVVRGLSFAVAADIGDDDKKKARAMLDRGIGSVMRSLEDRALEPEQRIDLAYAMLETGRLSEAASAVDGSYAERAKLGVYGQAQLLECLDRLNRNVEARRVRELLESAAEVSGSAASWRSADRHSWFSRDEETTALVVKAFARVAPEHPLLPKAVTWLSRKRTLGYWVSTKTTAAVVNALSCYVERTGELSPDLTAAVSLNGRKLVDLAINKDARGTWDGRITLAGTSLAQGNVVELSTRGTGRVYYTVSARYCLREERIKPVNDGLGVSRTYTQLLYVKGRKGEWEVQRRPFSGKLVSGDEIEVSVTVTAPRAYEHLLLEDYFPSGVEVLTKPDEWYRRWCGWWWRGYTHKEARDDRMVFFLDHVDKGDRTFTYLLRAETPGSYHGLPARAELMYEPEVNGNSGEVRMAIADR